MTYNPLGDVDNSPFRAGHSRISTGIISPFYDVIF